MDDGLETTKLLILLSTTVINISSTSAYGIIADEKTATEEPSATVNKPATSPTTHASETQNSTTKSTSKDGGSMNQKSEPETNLQESSSELIAVFSNHEDFLSTKISVSDAQSSSTSMSRKPTAMHYFYGFSDVVSRDI